MSNVNPTGEGVTSQEAVNELDTNSFEGATPQYPKLTPTDPAAANSAADEGSDEQEDAGK